MKTMRLWLEADGELPMMRRLRYAWAEVPLREVLVRGIHPWQGPHAHPSLLDAMMARLNDPGVKPGELAAHGHCPDLRPGPAYYPYAGRSPLERFLEQVAGRTYFVEPAFGYSQLVSLALGRLREHWSHHTARELLSRSQPDFKSLRRFLKSKTPDLRLRGYVDLARHDFSELLSPDDFADQPDLLLRAAFPGAAFRLGTFVSLVTDDEGHLSLLPEIADFGVVIPTPTAGYPGGSLSYACHRDGQEVRLIPNLTGTGRDREGARQIAARWGDGRARYCFSMGLDPLCELVEAHGAQIDFASLSYTGNSAPPSPQARVSDTCVTPFTPGAPLTVDDTAETLRDVLAAYGARRSGNKARLAHNLAGLCAQVYRQHEPALDRFFTKQRFIRGGGPVGQALRRFPVLEGCPLRDTVLGMYLLRHLRGDAIVEAGYVDDSYELEDLARALIEKRVRLSGCYLKVADVAM